MISPVLEGRLQYQSPAGYDAVLPTEVRVTVAERARLNCGYRMVKQAPALILEAESFHVGPGPVGKKPKRSPISTRSFARCARAWKL